MTKKVSVLLLSLLVLSAGMVLAEEWQPDDWIEFMLICNEGMLNDGGNVGNTIMILSMNPRMGIIKELVFQWDVFIEYPGYETPQLLDQPFRVNGPEESVLLFNQNFGLNMTSFLSLNFLNLSSIIDKYGGVMIDITRAERNALNGMVAAKLEHALSTLGEGLMHDNLYTTLLDEYYLLDYGPETHLSGIQAVGYGWLQYDSVANCAMRELEVVAQLFFQMKEHVYDRVWFGSEGDVPGEDAERKRIIYVDNITESDRQFLLQMSAPVFDNAYHNLTDEQIWGITETLLIATHETSAAYDYVQLCILPIEGENERERIGSANGIVIDYEANKEALDRFLRDPDFAPMIIGHAGRITGRMEIDQ